MSFYRITRNPADKWFSYYIRFKYNWKCQVCGKLDIARATNHQELLKPGPSVIECLHIISRSNWNTRYCEENALAGCHGCHDIYTHDSTGWREWVKKHYPGRYDMMKIKSNIPNSMVKRMIPAIANEFKIEAKLLAQRSDRLWVLKKDLGKEEYELALRHTKIEKHLGGEPIYVPDE